METNDRRNNGNVLAGLAEGIIAGLAASWTMKQFQSVMSKLQRQMANKLSQESQQQEQESQQQEQGSSSQEPATVKAAEAFSRNVLNRPLAESEKQGSGEIAHYAMGTVSGATYGILARKAPTATWGRGLLFGTALWLTADEGVVPALGFSKAPWQYPLSTHVSALAGHLVYATSLDLLSRGLSRLF